MIVTAQTIESCPRVRNHQSMAAKKTRDVEFMFYGLFKLYELQ